MLRIVTLLTVFLTSLTALSAGTAMGEENIITKLQDGMASMVTVQGETLSPSSMSGKIEVHIQSGAGVIIDARGLIVTNTHIVYGSQIIKVTLRDNSSLPARVVYVSPVYDFTILEIHANQPLTAVEWGDSDSLTLGQDVLTIGHSPLLSHTISGGSVVGLGTRTTKNGDELRELFRLNINHYQGDSGGPVLDGQGRLVGLVSAKRLTVDRSALAVPSNKIHFAYLNLVNAVQNK